MLSFGSPLLFNTGATTGNTAVAIGDLNGDGHPDLVTGTAGGGITISMGNGDGTFTQSGKIAPFATSLASVTLADLDGQNGLDIIATDPTDNEVWVIRNQGNGTFGTPTPYSTGLGSSPVDVAVADLGNGHPDLVTANSGDNSVSVLLGDGTGNYQPHQDYPVDTDPVAVVIGSFVQGQRPLDLFTANEGGNSVSVLRGNGDGTFKPAMDIPITVTVSNQTSRLSKPVDLAIGDFNGDGNLDLVTANTGTASVTVMLGNGDGSFGVQQNIVVDSNTTRADAPTAVIAADLDGSGSGAIAFTEPKRGAIGVLTDNGAGSFGNQVDYVASGDPLGLAVANLNGDKTSLGLDRLDVVTADPTDSHVAILLGQKYSDSTTLTGITSTVTYGTSIGYTEATASGIAPSTLSLSRSYQLYVDSQKYGALIPINSINSTGITGLAVGKHTISASFLGTDDFLPSSSPTMTVTVLPATLSLTALDQTRTYGDVNPAFTYSITGFVNGDFLDQFKLTGKPSTTTTAVDRTSPAGVYPISITQGSLEYTDPDYTFGPSSSPYFVTGKLTITPAPLTVALNFPQSSLTRPYGQANPVWTVTLDSFSYTGFVNGENQDQPGVLSGCPSVSTLATAASKVGTYPVMVSVGSLWSPNYTFTFQSGTLTVTQASLTVSDVVATRTYGSTSVTIDSSWINGITGFVNGETLDTSDVTGSPGITTAATVTSPIGSYVGTPNQGTLKSSNYSFNFTQAAGTLTVTPAQLTVTADDVSRYYGLSNSALTYTITGFVDGETAATAGVAGTLQLTTSAVTSSDVGTYPITVVQDSLAAPNYVFQVASSSSALTINPARLIVVAEDVQRSFGTDNPQSLGWVLEREDAPQTTISPSSSVSSGAPIITTATTTASPVGTYPIAIGQGNLAILPQFAGDYELDVSNFQPGVLTITQATLTITATNASRAYGAADPTFSYKVSGFIQGDNAATAFTGAPSFTPTSGSTSHVGTYQVIPSLGTLQSSNYLFAFVPGTLTITPAPLTIKANDTSQAYGTTPSLSASYVGLVNSDTAASLSSPAVLSTTATTSSLPGSYPITVKGAASPDYSITFVGGTFTVSKSTTSASMEGPMLRVATTSPVTFTVDLLRFSGGSAPATGNVIFYDWSRVFGVAPVVNGKAILTTTALAQGNHMIFAVYQGDNNYAPSVTGTITQMIFSTAPAAKVTRSAPVARHPKQSKPKPKPKPKLSSRAKSHPVANARVTSLARPRMTVPSRLVVKTTAAHGKA